MSDLSSFTRETASAAGPGTSPMDMQKLLDLYDQVAPDVWDYARHRTRSRGVASALTLEVFLAALENPDIISDDRFSVRTGMLLLVHLRTASAKTSRLSVPGLRQFTGLRRVRRSRSAGELPSEHALLRQHSTDLHLQVSGGIDTLG